MKITSASFTTVILRFYLMMAIVISTFILGYPVLAIIAVPVFLSGLAGVSFKKASLIKVKTRQLNTNQNVSQQSAA